MIYAVCMSLDICFIVVQLLCVGLAMAVIEDILLCAFLSSSSLCVLDWLCLVIGSLPG